MFFIISGCEDPNKGSTCETVAEYSDCAGIVSILELILGVELIIMLVVDVAGMLVGLPVGVTILGT